MKVVSGLCLFVVILAYTSAQVPPADGTCEPGKVYKVDCNTCECGANGRLGICTQIACPPRHIRQVRGAQLPTVSADSTCEPGTSYKDDCNICVCSPEGKWGGCTEKACPPRHNGQIQGAQLPPAPADGTCEPGKSYKVDCNTCICAPNGKLGACTLAACPRSKRQAKDPQECAEGETKQEVCNTCHCFDGKWGCTKKFCPKQNRKRRSTPLPPLPADGTCVAGNSYQQDCNTCRCLANNVLACTKSKCTSKRSADPQECSEGQTKQEECNTCHCTNGQWGCTKILCNRKRRDTDKCTVGDYKKDDCNTCNCIQLGDGTKDWACTKLACPQAPSRITRRDAGEACSVGDNKQDDCNTCKCIKTGDGSIGWACTRMTCPSRSRRDV